MRKKIVSILSILALVVVFQNCGGHGAVQFSSTGLVMDQDSEFISIDDEAEDQGTVLVDVISPPKNCTEGVSLGIWLDVDSSGKIAAKNYLGEIVPYTGRLSSVKNYNYYSASAHPKQGPIPRGFEANIFFYEETNGDYSLNFFANLDGGGSHGSKFDIDLNVSGNNLRDYVLLSDDKLELKKVMVASGSSTYKGRFHYWKNTDGGVIGPLRGDDFTIQVKLSELGDNKEALFYSANGSSFKLKTKVDVSPAFIIQKNRFVSCE